MTFDVPKPLIDAVTKSVRSGTLANVQKTTDGYELTFRGLGAGKISADRILDELAPALEEYRHSTSDKTSIIFRCIWLP